MLVFLAFTLLFAVPVNAAQSAGSVTDQQLKTRVEQRLVDRRVRGIKVSIVRDGTIALTGPVASAGAKQDLIADVLKVDGVKEIVSELTIGRAESDQKLAERIAEQMRRSTYFTVFDDVQIGVDNGVVTLTGYVTQPIKSDDLARRASHVDGVVNLSIVSRCCQRPWPTIDSGRSSPTRSTAIRHFPITPRRPSHRCTSSFATPACCSPAS